MAEADIWEKLCVIDTENESGSLYVGTVVNGVRVGEYLTINLEAPFSAARYLEAIDVAEQNGVEFLIIDSLSHAWSGEGGLLDVQSNIAKRSGNSYTAWREVTPQHNKLVDRVLQCPMHVAITLRTKTEYVIEDNGNGKKSPKKVGMAPVFRDGIEYEVTVFFELGQDHVASVTKDVSGRYAYEKRLNTEVLLQSREFRRGILDGFYATDGGNSNRIYTTSEGLLHDIECLCTSLGLNTVMDVCDRTDEPVIIRGAEWKRNYPLYCLRWYGGSNKRSMGNVFVIRNNGMYFRVDKVTKMDETPYETVYCFEVKDQREPYFTLPNGMITHNCRLRNELQDNTFSYTLGAGGVATGLVSVPLRYMHTGVETISLNTLENLATLFYTVAQDITPAWKEELCWND